MRLIPLIIGCLSLLSQVRAQTVDGYTFLLDGKPEDPYWLQVDSAALSAGDVIFIRDIPLCLDEPGIYRFEVKDGLVHRIFGDGRSVVVACEVNGKYDESLPEEKRYNGNPLIINPLSGMSDAALKSLRGVSIDVWSKDVAKQLEKLDLEHVCIRVQAWALHDCLPPLPKGVRTLILHSGGGWSCKDMSGFRRLQHLRLLELKDTMPGKFDFEVLRGMPLEYLSLPWAHEPSHLEVLGSFDKLKTLAANHCSFLGDGRWIAQLTNLRTLYASHVRSASDGDPVALDLAALSGLQKLREIHVQSTPVKSLPSTPMPALTRVSLLLSNAPTEDIDALARANPQAVISRSMNAQLSAQLAKADRILVRTGGVCHRRAEREKVIVESRDAAVIAELAEHFTINEDSSGGHCMCCGNPTFEFYQGDKQVAMVAFHHGQSIRWADGTWPGDGILKEQSSTYLVEWLAKNNYTGSREELFEGRRQAAAQRRRDSRISSLLPAAVSEGLSTAESLDQATAAFEKHVPDVKSRASLYLRLFGCEDSTWALSTGMDGTLQETWLPGIPKETLQAVILAASIPSEESMGAARWVFGLNHTDLIKQDGAALTKLARFALTHPRQSNRWRTLAVLRDTGTPEAVSLLRQVMRQGTQPRELEKDQIFEPGGQMTLYPNNISLPYETSDTAAAALCLALLGDAETKAEVEKVRTSLPEAARKKWAEAISRKK
ncbi:MAG: hypothetical protein WAW39_28280 [Prosthecobacter sp.]|uniref:hypothetical protein n=1 Tax=Prosthecobacter sp. TaxID=1965333 RepID=UPI003BAF6939